ncbi:MAG TPA: prenyltransferase/squalene oxidase repeat-containing protein [Lacipirellulaceae bacterium]
MLLDCKATRSRKTAVIAAALASIVGNCADFLHAQDLPDHVGEAIPRDIREMYDRGLQYLVKTQSEEGDWRTGQQGPGTTGLALMAFLASGEDPNFGLYSNPVRKSVRSIIRAQDPRTGYFGNSMYHHGFAMLGLAEAYGSVDDRNLWPAGEPGGRSIGAALELAVRAAVTSQKKNSFGAWRYSPDSPDADTSVSGAVLVGLLAARNAGIDVPDEAIDRAISYYQSMTSDTGGVAYSGIGDGGESIARISIASLVYSIARRKDLPQHRATLDYLTQHLEDFGNSPYREYTLYYQAQALFQGDVAAWEKWNKLLVRQLKQQQQPDGSFPGQFGAELGTSMSLLALALNYRLLPIYER